VKLDHEKATENVLSLFLSQFFVARKLLQLLKTFIPTPNIIPFFHNSHVIMFGPLMPTVLRCPIESDHHKDRLDK